MWNLRTAEEQKSQRFEPLVCFANVFTAEECDQIVQLAQTEFDRESAGIDLANSRADQIRKGHVNWLDPQAESTHWIYRRLTDAIRAVNQGNWEFELDFVERLQFTCYDEPQDKYEAHIDNLIGGGLYRKLSFSVQLTDANAYGGAELEIHSSPVPIVAPKQQGSISFFPSVLLHKVTPLTWGKRYSLVGWVCGPKFR
jgi:PKHD-type hydroxylase